MDVVLAVGGALLSPVCEMLLEKLRSSDLLNYAREGDVLTELKRWDRMLKKIGAVLQDAEEKQMTSRSVQKWVGELRNLAFDVEDVLDEFSTEILRRKVEAVEPVARTTKLRKFIPACCATCSVVSKVKFNAEMMSKIKSISQKFDEIMEEKDQLSLGERTGEMTIQGSERLPTTSLVNEAKVYGRENDRNFILEMLKAEASNAAFSVLAIVGMGGLGKTTLAQLIYNDDATSEFDFKAWVSVGEDFDVFRITKTFLQPHDSSDNDLNSLQVKLKEKLSGKGFLIVLDDVWTKDYDRWTLLCAAFEFGAPRSKIIVTTRDQNVSSMMGAAQTCFLKQLSYDDCFSVFAQHALGATNFDHHLDFKATAEEIVKRCKGLPLAAKALGGVVRGKLDHKLWERVLQNNIWEGEETNILPALRVSYYQLPPHLKRCFAYCAMFPDEFEFDKDELVLLWMAEGFLQQPRKNQLIEDLGHEYFDELLSRSFFQVSNKNESSYVMHDLMRDLARSVSQETSFILDQWNHAESLENDQHLAEMIPAKSFENVRHSSFTRVYNDTSPRYQVFYKMKKLRTLLSLPILPRYRWNHLNRNVLNYLVPELKCLRVLSLAGYQLVELPSSIDTLKLLRYLDLSCTEIVRLPISICRLFNLQTLKLLDCEDLIQLPVDIDNLINLRHLDIRGTTKMKWMPLQIGNLANLCTLTKFIVGDDSSLQLRELKKFPLIKGELDIEGLQNVVKIEDAEITNLKGKQGLDKLVLEWARDCDDLHNTENASQFLKLLQPHTNVKSLGIAGYGGAKFPSWLVDHSFNKMVDVKLKRCHQITSLPPLGQLPFLRDLHIEEMPEVEEMGVEFYGNGSTSFPSLENFHIENMSKLAHWSPGNFPKLQQLLLRNCPALVDKVPSCISSLRELTIGRCQEVVLRSVCDLTSLATLRISHIEGLLSLDELHLEGSTTLKELSIRNCDELAHLWQYGTDAHNNVLSLILLDISSCEKLTSFVEGEEGLLPRNLQKLNIDSCNLLEDMPNGLHSVTSLRDLTILECRKLASLPVTGLPYSLENLRISSCDSLEALREGTITNMPSHLKILEIEVCPSLKSLSLPIDALVDSLRTLKICYCTNPLLDSLCKFHLMELALVGCSELESFPENGLRIPTLVKLSMISCGNLRSLPNNLCHLTSLQHLDIYDCESVESFPENGLRIPTLVELSIRDCWNLRSLPNDLPPNLTSLCVRDCNSMAQPISQWGLYRLTSLRSLELRGLFRSTDKVRSFPNDDEGHLLIPSSLADITIGDFCNLESLSRGLQSLTSLEDLWISNCPKLKSLPNEGFPATLGYLNISGCHLLKDCCSKDDGVYWPIIANIPHFEFKVAISRIY